MASIEGFLPRTGPRTDPGLRIISSSEASPSFVRTRRTGTRWREREREREISHGCLEECSCLNMVTKIVGYEPQFTFSKYSPVLHQHGYFCVLMVNTPKPNCLVHCYSVLNIISRKFNYLDEWRWFHLDHLSFPSATITTIVNSSNSSSGI